MDETHSIDTLKSELSNKDRLIQALTEQLETTADQLDRLQRSGGALQKDSGFGVQVAAQIRQTAADFEDVSVLEHFERIEVGVEQILEILSGEASPLDSIDRGTNLNSSSIFEDETPSQQPEANSNSEDFWAATKARLMGEETSSTSPDEGQTSSPNTSSAADLAATQSDLAPTDAQTNQTAQSVPTKIHIPPTPEPLPDLPKPVEKSDDVNELEGAVTERDGLITYLIARLRTAEMYAFPPIDWNRLSNAPEELKEGLIILQQHLKDHLRQAELSVSLERASLTRERSKLKQVKKHLAAEIQRMGRVSEEASEKVSMEDRLSRLLEAQKPSRSEQTGN